MARTSAEDHAERQTGPGQLKFLSRFRSLDSHGQRDALAAEYGADRSRAARYYWASARLAADFLKTRGPGASSSSSSIGWIASAAPAARS